MWKLACNHLHCSTAPVSETSARSSVRPSGNRDLMLHREVVISLDGLHSRLGTCLVHMGDVSRQCQQLIIAISTIFSTPDTTIEVVRSKVRSRFSERNFAERLVPKKFILLNCKLQEIVNAKLTWFRLLRRRMIMD